VVDPALYQLDTCTSPGLSTPVLKVAATGVEELVYGLTVLSPPLKKKQEPIAIGTLKVPASPFYQVTGRPAYIFYPPVIAVKNVVYSGVMFSRINKGSDACFVKAARHTRLCLKERLNLVNS